MILLLLKLDSPINWKIRFEERPGTSLLDFSSVLYDVNLLHDVVVLSLLPEYKKYKFSQYFWYRRGRPLHENHRLLLKRIRSESPIELVTVIAAAAASVGILWALLQSIEKIANWELNRQKLELEVENLICEKQKRTEELKKAFLDREKAMVEIERVLAERESHMILDRILKRIDESNLIATDVSFSDAATDADDKETDLG